MLQLIKLSPAQRAWETRRAKAEGRAIVEARKIEIATPVTVSPLGEAKMVTLWLDRLDVGCGLRRYIVLDIGARLVRLFSAAKLLTIEVDRAEFDRYARPVRGKAKAVSTIIKANQRLADRINGAAQTIIIPDGGADAVRAIGRFA
jgi:hypothetical protein